LATENTGSLPFRQMGTQEFFNLAR